MARRGGWVVAIAAFLNGLGAGRRAPAARVRPDGRSSAPGETFKFPTPPRDLDWRRLTSWNQEVLGEQHYREAIFDWLAGDDRDVDQLPLFAAADIGEVGDR